MTHGLRARWSGAAGPDRRRLVDLGDRALLGLVRAGDTAAFAELYERHRLAAGRLARRLVHGRVDADDVVAETFTRVLRALRHGAGPTDGFRVYLFTAVRRTAWYLENKDCQELSTDAADLDRPDDGPDLEIAAAERGLMSRAFASLPERWRTVLWHTEVEGEPARQVARILGISPNGVAALTYRARGALTAAYLQAHLAAPPSPQCRPFAEKLGEYAADRSGPRERDRIAAHLTGCADCRQRVAELRDVRTSLRAAAGPLLLGPAALGYFTHGKVAICMGALVQHGKVTAAATVSGAAASGEAVAQLVSHHGKLGAALAGAALTAAGALGLVVADPSIPEASSPRVVLTVAAPPHGATDTATPAAAGEGSPSAPGADSAQPAPGGRTAADPGTDGAPVASVAPSTSGASAGGTHTAASEGSAGGSPATGTAGSGTSSGPSGSSPDGSPASGAGHGGSAGATSPTTSAAGDPGSTTTTTTTTSAAGGQPGGSGGAQPAGGEPTTDPPSSTATVSPTPTATTSPAGPATMAASPPVTAQNPATGPQKAQ